MTLTSIFLTLLQTLLLTQCIRAATLQLYPAGPIPSEPIRNLSATDVICGSDFDEGYTFRCVGTELDEYAIFSVNSAQVRRENVAPFFIAGDNNNMATAFEAPSSSSSFTVSCALTSGTVSVSVTLACPQVSSSPTPSATPSTSSLPEMQPAQMYFVSTNPSVRTIVPLQRGMTFCPMHAFNSWDFTVSCGTSATATSARFRVDGVRVRWTNRQPFLITAVKNGVTKAWKKFPTSRFTIQCVHNDKQKSSVRRVLIACPTPTPTATPSPSLPSEYVSAGCIVIPGASTTLSEGWEEVSDGVEFNPGKSSKKITWKGEAPLWYEFVAKQSGHHAIVLDMTTRSDIDYNDVWLNFPDGGFTLMRGGEVDEGDGWIKGYHNEDGRAALVFSVNHDPHSISTKIALEKGKTYSIGVAGRSNQVIVHNILLFVCEGNGCQTWQWIDTLRTCQGSSS